VGLSPEQAVNLALRAAAPPWGWAGPASPSSAMDQLARSLGIDKVVSFCGWLRHEETMRHLVAADVLA